LCQNMFVLDVGNVPPTVPLAVNTFHVVMVCGATLFWEDEGVGAFRFTHNVWLWATSVEVPASEL